MTLIKSPADNPSLCITKAIEDVQDVPVITVVEVPLHKIRSVE